MNGPVQANLRVIQTAVDQSTDGILITTPDLDPPGPKIIYANPAFSRISGYSVEDVIGKTPRILQGAKSDRKVLDRVRATLEAGQEFFGETINYRKDGSEFWMEWHIAPVRDEQGRISHWVAVQRDVTEEKEKEARLQLAKQQLQQENERRRSAEVELRAEQDLLRHLYRIQVGDRQLIAYDIHDGLMQYATGALIHLNAWLKRHEEGSTDADTHLVAGQLQKIVEDGRALMNSLRPPGLDSQGLVAAVENLIESQRSTAPAVYIEASTNLPRMAPTVESNAFRIVQEAVTNARKHSGSEKVEVRITEKQDRLHIQVQDWGVGFDPSTSADGGMGLKGIRERVTLLGGNFAIDSAPGKGTQICVDLPARFVRHDI